MIFVVKIAFCQKNAPLNIAEMPTGTAFHINLGDIALPPLATKKNDLSSIFEAIRGQKSENFIKYLQKTKKISHLSINYNLTPFSVIPVNFYTQNFGFFCKKEMQVQKITRLPLLFRLGSVQQCNWLEGKKGANFLLGN